MNAQIKLNRLIGYLGIAMVLVSMVEIPLYFISETPSTINVLTRVLLNILITTSLLVFLFAFRQCVLSVSKAAEWIASLMVGAGLVYIALTLAADSMQAGAMIAAQGSLIDPTVTADGQYLMYGSIGRLLMALVLGTAGYITMTTKVFPVWTGWVAYVAAIFSLAFVPAMYFGNDPAVFYSANGWGTTALAAGSIMYWILAVSITAFRAKSSTLEKA